MTGKKEKLSFKKVYAATVIIAAALISAACMRYTSSGGDGESREQEEKIPLLVGYREDTGQYVLDMHSQFYDCSHIVVSSVKDGEHDIQFVNQEERVLKTERMGKGQQQFALPQGTAYVTVSGSRKEENDLRMEGILSSEGSEEREQYELDTALKGRNISIIGDSVSAYEGYIPGGFFWHYPNGDVTLKDMWWYRLAKRFGMNISRVDACAGAGVTELPWLYNPDADAQSGKALHTLGREPDMILIWLGGNDVLGGFADQAAENYRKLVGEVKQEYPMAELYLCTYYLIEPEETLKALNEEIRRIAAEYQTQIIDLEACGISSANQERYIMDGTHPNRKGFQLISAWMREELLKKEEARS